MPKLINMGNILKKLGNYHEAIDAFKKAVFIQPDHAKAYGNMGVALHNQVD